MKIFMHKNLLIDYCFLHDKIAGKFVRNEKNIVEEIIFSQNVTVLLYKLS